MANSRSRTKNGGLTASVLVCLSALQKTVLLRPIPPGESRGRNADSWPHPSRALARAKLLRMRRRSGCDAARSAFAAGQPLSPPPVVEGGRYRLLRLRVAGTG